MQHVWGREEVHTGYRWKNLRAREHWESPGSDLRIILKPIVKKWDGASSGLIWPRQGSVSGSCEQSNEPSASIKCGEFLN